VLGIQPKPVLVELIGWLVYLVPMLAYLFVPARHHRGTSITQAPVQASA
jgi:hypothetical protein